MGTENTEDLTDAELEALTAPPVEESPAEEAATEVVADEEAAPPAPKKAAAMSEDELWAKARQRNPRLPEKPYPTPKQDAK